VAVDLAAQGDERAGRAIGCRTDIPAELIDAREAFGQAAEVELETDESRLSIIAAA